MMKIITPLLLYPIPLLNNRNIYTTFVRLRNDCTACRKIQWETPVRTKHVFAEHCLKIFRWFFIDCFFFFVGLDFYFGRVEIRTKIRYVRGSPSILNLDLQKHMFNRVQGRIQGEGSTGGHMPGVGKYLSEFHFKNVMNKKNLLDWFYRIFCYSVFKKYMQN